MRSRSPMRSSDSNSKAGPSTTVRPSRTAPRYCESLPYLHQAYTASDAGYTGKVAVPTLWDTKTRRIVNNGSGEMIRMLNDEFAGYRRRRWRFLSEGFAQQDRSPQRDHLCQRQQRRHGCGFAKSQAAYEAASTHCSPPLTSSMHGLPPALLCGRTITEADWRCFQRSCAPTSPISRCFAATSSASTTIPISRITCASFVSCPASPRP